MFKRFTAEESISGHSALKSSQQRAARTQIISHMPSIEPYIDDFFPKKSKTISAKCTGHISLLLSADGEPQFVLTRDAGYTPTLRTLHRYPFLLPVVRVDRGAIKHVMNGADVMVPGLKSAKAEIDDRVEKEMVVGVFGEGKKHAIAIGIAKMGATEMKTCDRGIAIETLHHVGDGLWKCERVD